MISGKKPQRLKTAGGLNYLIVTECFNDSNQHGAHGRRVIGN